MRPSRCCAVSGPVRRSATTARSARSPTWPSRPARSKTPSTCGWAAMCPAALERCGRIGDGWLPAFCTPGDAASAKVVIDEVAAEHGRAISPEHFGVSIAYAPPGTDLSAAPIGALARRARGRPLDEIIPVGLDGLRALHRGLPGVGFSKFIVRPLAPPGRMARRTRTAGRLRWAACRRDGRGGGDGPTGARPRWPSCAATMPTPHRTSSAICSPTCAGWRPWSGPGAAPICWPSPRSGTPPTAPMASSPTCSSWPTARSWSAPSGPKPRAGLLLRLL